MKGSWKDITKAVMLEQNNGRKETRLVSLDEARSHIESAQLLL